MVSHQWQASVGPQPRPSASGGDLYTFNRRREDCLQEASKEKEQRKCRPSG